MNKALMALAAAAAIAAASVISVMALAFALFAGLGPWIGSAWAAAAVAALMALIVLAFAMLASRRTRRRLDPGEPYASMVDKIVAMAKERPLLAAGVALGAGVYAIRNPKLIAALAAAFMEGRQSAR